MAAISSLIDMKLLGRLMSGLEQDTRIQAFAGRMQLSGVVPKRCTVTAQSVR
jgi:hypothetical protein